MNGVSVALSGFPSVLTHGWIWGRRLLVTGLLVAGGLVVLNAIHLYGLLATVHVWLARVVTLGLAGGLLLWCAYVFWRYLRTPRALTPPDLSDPAEWTAGEQRAYREFATRYLRRQEKNPHLPDEAKQHIATAIDTIARATGDSTELCRTVDAQLERVLAPLDERANRLIRRAAVEVATATAISPSILLDSLITLTRNVDLISRMADLYYGRPGLFGTLRILRDVIGSAVAAGALEMVSEHLSGALAEMTGSWSARLVGPLGQGMVNGVVTLRFGAAAKWRCRSLIRRKVPWRPWDPAQYRRAFSSLLQWISKDVGPNVFGPLQRVVTWTGQAAETTVEGGKSFLRKVRDTLSRKREGTETETETFRDDPVVDRVLLEGD